jgi:hypothetical protein
MTEPEWLAATDILRLLSESYARESSIRKWRMFAISCCRSVWAHLSEWARQSLVILENVAGGELPDSARAERSKTAPQPQSYADRAVWKAIRPGKEARAFARYDIPRHILSAAGPHDGDPGREAVRKILADAARDIFGNPFRTSRLTFDPAWRSGNDAASLILAQSAYNEHSLPAGELDPARLAVLSDALEESSCTDDEILGHLRSPGPHVRGCWALDLVLGKQ